MTTDIRGGMACSFAVPPIDRSGQNPKCSGERRRKLSYTAIIIEWINLSRGNAISLGSMDLDQQLHDRAGSSILS